MNELLPIIRRQRRSLQTATTPVNQQVEPICPHCGRSAAEPVKSEPASVPQEATVADKTVLPSNQLSEDAPEQL
jgi:hypothetical protein